MPSATSTPEGDGRAVRDPERNLFATLAWQHRRVQRGSRTTAGLTLVGVLLVASVLIVGPSARAAAGGCPSRPFVGVVERTADDTTEQPAVEVGGGDIERGLGFDFGTARNTTVYLASYPLRASELGETIVAPKGETLVTIFLRPASGDLEPGRKLRLPRDQITAIVDSGGGAQATTSGANATVRVLAFDDDRVCFSINYRDDFQVVKGKVRAAFP
jgi:hypothetical protein